MYGIGSTTARRLYSLGMKTLDDLKKYYGVEVESYAHGSGQELNGEENEDASLAPQLPDELLHEGNERGIRESLRLHADLTSKFVCREVAHCD